MRTEPQSIVSMLPRVFHNLASLAQCELRYVLPLLLRLLGTHCIEVFHCGDLEAVGGPRAAMHRVLSVDYQIDARDEQRGSAACVAPLGIDAAPLTVRSPHTRRVRSDVLHHAQIQAHPRIPVLPLLAEAASLAPHALC